MNTMMAYQCNVCGATYKDEENCRQCEAFHIQPYRLEAGFFKHPSAYPVPYPEHVLISMRDGMIVRYVFDEVVCEQENNEVDET